MNNLSHTIVNIIHIFHLSFLSQLDYLHKFVIKIPFCLTNLFHHLVRLQIFTFSEL
jgi:hypothetical protein